MSSIRKVSYQPQERYQQSNHIGDRKLTHQSNLNSDDTIGMFFGYYSLLVYEIQAVYITLFLWNRDLLTFWCCFTHLLSEIMNYALKYALKHPRPANGAPSGGLFEGRYGMPSQHCHCFAYLVTVVLALVFHYYRHQISPMKKALVLAISLICLALQVIGRVYLRFHTLDQCLVGVSLGVSSAIMFYIIGVNFFLPHSQYLCRTWILRWLSFRKDLISPMVEPAPSAATTDSYRFDQCLRKIE